MSELTPEDLVEDKRWNLAKQQARVIVDLIQEHVKEAEARMLERCIEKQCSLCNGDMGHVEKSAHFNDEGEWVHEYLDRDDQDPCECPNLHDLKQEQG